mgnify:CR=1 FL=1
MLLYRILIAVLVLLASYLLYTNYTLNTKVDLLKQSLIQTEEQSIKNRNYLIDSLQKSKLIITKEILQNEKAIEKIKSELKKTNTTNLSLEDAKKLLGL